MRWSRYYLFTSKEVPKEAEIASHKLMIRAGLIRKHSAGIYSYLPALWRSIQKFSNIVREELDRKGAVELQMPAVQPAELWKESGRWYEYGKELLRIKDRHNRDFCFGPTHEEIVTAITRADIRSYKQLPFNLYQIQVKFRDEIRPRFGLLRAREFIMKDAYSFHSTRESLDETYNDMRDAYSRILERSGFKFSVVEAATGAIGGSVSHEFVVFADHGESLVITCPKCGYAANVEKASFYIEPKKYNKVNFEIVPTPGKSRVKEVADFLGVSTDSIVKTLIYKTPEKLIAVAVAGDREVSEEKLRGVLGTQGELADDKTIEDITNAPVGFAGPVGLSEEIELLVDKSAAAIEYFVCGANKKDAHIVGATWDKVGKFKIVDIAEAKKGDKCVRCKSLLKVYRGIEVGHIFKLGTKYSEAMKCYFLDKDGKSKPVVMGCYGLGIGRSVAAAIEQHHDDKGIVWPVAIAPFECVVMPLNTDNTTVVSEAESIYSQLKEKGIDTIIDDRDERAGFKFKDSDLLGFPLKVIVGAKTIKEGKVEIELRKDGSRLEVKTSDVVSKVGEILSDHKNLSLVSVR